MKESLRLLSSANDTWQWPRWLATIVCACLLAVVTQASAAAPNNGLLGEFEEVSARAETELSSPLGKHEFEKAAELDQLREKLASIRDRAQAVAGKGTLASRQMQARIDSLGPPPSTDQSEPEFIAKRRAELNEDLARLQAPLMRYREIQYRAASLVKDVDQRIHSMNNKRLFSRAYSPLDPRLWSRAYAELRAAPSQGPKSSGMASKGIGALGWLARVGGGLAACLVAYALYQFVWRRTRQRIERRIQSTDSVAGRLLLILFEDAVSAVLFGLLLILATVFCISLFLGVTREEVLFSIGVSVVLAGLMLAVAHWLGRSVLMSPIPELRLIDLEPNAAGRASRTIRGLGAVLALELVLELLEQGAYVPSSIANLLSTLLLIAGSALIWRLAGQINVRRDTQKAEPADIEQAGRAAHNTINFAGTIGRTSKFLAIVAIVTALTGFMVLTREVFTGVLLSLAVIGISVYAHRTIKFIVSALTAGPLAQFRSILRFIPLVAGFVLLLVALFLIALVWGYRLQEIMDGLILLRTGIEFGEVRISAGDVFTFALVFFVGYVITRWVQRFMRLSLLPEFNIDLGAQAALITGIGYLGVMLAAVVAIASTGLDLTSLAFVFGALSVGIGFGLQSVVENFTSGILLLIERPIRVGDWIEVGEHSGVVKRIAVRSTQIETWDRHQIIIPNSQLISGSVKNFSLTGEPARVVVPAGVSYDSDVDVVKALLLDIASDHEKVLDQPEPFVTLDGFGDSSIDLKLFVFVADVTTGAGVRSDLNFLIARRFAAEGIEIPFPQRDVRIRSGLPVAQPTTDESLESSASSPI